jgi:hypothetical protein
MAGTEVIPFFGPDGRLTFTPPDVGWCIMFPGRRP